MYFVFLGWLRGVLNFVRGGGDRKKRGLFKNVHFLEMLENLEIPESLETVENKRESNRFLEILESLEILEIPPVKRPLSS